VVRILDGGEWIAYIHSNPEREEKMRWLLVLLLSAGISHAKGETAGDFDYYVLSLSWSPSWCATTGNQRDAAQCEAGRATGWVLHGLWPQNERGWPSYCRTDAPPPTRAQTTAMADITGSGGLAWHSWKKHGVCSGLTAQAFFSKSRAAFDSVTRPQVLRKVTKEIKLSATLIEDAWLQANPAMLPDQITITCTSGRIAEARICLTKSLAPRKCGIDVIKDCQMQDALFSPVK
jgi:ribonuclease T2